MLYTFHVHNSTSVIRTGCIIILIPQGKHTRFPCHSDFQPGWDVAKEFAGRILSLCTYPLKTLNHCHEKPLSLMGQKERWGGLHPQIEYNLFSAISQFCETNKPFLSTQTVPPKWTGSATCTAFATSCLFPSDLCDHWDSHALQPLDRLVLWIQAQAGLECGFSSLSSLVFCTWRWAESG